MTSALEKQPVFTMTGTLPGNEAGRGLLLLLFARTGENVSQRVVTLVAGVLEERFAHSYQRHHRAPRPGVHRRVGDGEFVLDRLGVDLREAFHQPRIRAGALQARLAPEVDRLDDERAAFPSAA